MFYFLVILLNLTIFIHQEANHVASSLAGNSFETIITKLSSVMLTVASNSSEKNSSEGSNYVNKVKLY